MDIAHDPSRPTYHHLHSTYATAYKGRGGHNRNIIPPNKKTLYETLKTVPYKGPQINRLEKSKDLISTVIGTLRWGRGFREEGMWPEVKCIHRQSMYIHVIDTYRICVHSYTVNNAILTLLSLPLSVGTKRSLTLTNL